MPRLGTWLVGLAVILVLVVVAAWQVPQYLDWNRYHATLEALASKTLGQPVTIHGPITLNLLPQPMLTAAQVNIGGDTPGDASIRVEALRLRVALWPLLGGRVDARELVLRGPDLRLPWPVEPRMLRAQTPAWLAAFSARVEDGRLTMGRMAFTGINATLASQNTGALSASGTARFNGQDWKFTARTTTVGPDGYAGLDLTLDGQDTASGLGASLSGQMASDGTFAGRISGSGGNLALLLPAPSVPFRADGRLTIGSGLVAIDDLALQLGGSPATGAVALRVAPNQRLDIALSAGRLDLDAWLPALLHANTAVGGVDLPIGVDFSVGQAPLGGGTLQQVRATFDLTDNALVLREAEALLPGNGRLHLTGRLARGDPAQQRFEGDAALDAPLLQTTLRWLASAAPAAVPDGTAHAPEGTLQRATLSSHLVADSNGVSLQHLAGTIDDSPVSGSMTLKSGKPPAMVADLSVGHVALDNWYTGTPPRFDIALRLTIGSATLAGLALRDASIDGTIEGGAITLRHANALVDGMQVSAAGMLGTDGLLTNGTLDLNAPDAARLGAMMPPAWRGTPALWHGPVKLTLQAAGPPNAMSFGITLALSDANLDARPTINLRDGRWQGEVTLRHPGAPRFVSAIGLPEQLGLADLPAWLGDGSLSLTAHLSGAPGAFSADDFEMTAGGIRLAGALAIVQRDGRPRVSGRISADALWLPLPNGDSNVPLPIGVLHGWEGSLSLSSGKVVVGPDAEIRDAKATMVVSDDALRIERLTGALDGGTVTGSGVFNAAASPPSLALKARLDDVAVSDALTGIPVDLRTGSVTGSVELSASGYSPTTLLATLTGHVGLTISDGTVAGFDLPLIGAAMEKPDPTTVKAASDALGTGTTAFDRLDFLATLRHGDLLLDTVTMQGPSGEADASGDVNLPTQIMDLRIALRPSTPRPAPDIALRLNGSIDHPQRTPELAGLARFVAERTH